VTLIEFLNCQNSFREPFDSTASTLIQNQQADKYFRISGPYGGLYVFPPLLQGKTRPAEIVNKYQCITVTLKPCHFKH